MTEPQSSDQAAGPAPAPKFCANCGAPLTATARFCQDCGAQTGFGAGAADVDLDDGLAHDDESFRNQPLVTGSRGLAASLPWILALVGLVGGSAYVAGQTGAQPTAQEPAPGGMVAPFARGGGGAPPDIASMTPNERANRLYGRIMQYVTAGKADSAAFFAPMALAAHEMLESPSADERYHLGQINEMIGNAPVARAQADTILKAEPDNLLGLMLASRAARMANRPMDAKPFEQHLLKVLDAQLATRKPEYDMHRSEIDRAAANTKTP
jgi:hypothetical protein